MAKTLRKPLPEDVDFMHASPRGDGQPPPGDLPADPQAGRPAGPQAPARPQGPARLPQHGPPLAAATAVSRPSPSSAIPGRPSPRSSSSPTSPVRWPRSPGSPCTSSTRSRSQFSKVRAFVFIDGLDEVTRFFERAEDIAEAVHRVNTEADVVWVDGHSDYGHAFEVFWQGVRQGRRPQDHRDDPRRRPQQLPRVAELDHQGDGAPGPPRLLAEPRAPAATGTPATRSSASTASTATASSSAATCASSRGSSTTWCEYGATLLPQR